MVEQGQDDPGSSGVGQCTTQAVQHVETRSNSHHGLNYTVRTEHSVTGVSPDRMPVRGSFTVRRASSVLESFSEVDCALGPVLSGVVSSTPEPWSFSSPVH
ncbi:hypothetical protein MICRO116_700004 [Micrococcus sp. 116]|nr:hypothetical protein MICRO116_700004 [Micrococcus sp. 116]